MSKQILKTKVHTIFLMVGPSGCGKTTFSKECLIPQLQGIALPKPNPLSKALGKAGYAKKPEVVKPKRNVAYISSDDIRQELLGYACDKYADEMLFTSEQAFKLLYKKLESVLAFPVNAEFVVIDTTGLSQSFRDIILKIGKENCYETEAVVFGYKDKEEYTKYLEGYDKGVVFRQMRRFNRETQKELNRKDFRAIHKIKSKDFSNVEFEITNLKDYEETYLPDGLDYEYPIISDIHGCLPEFKELLTKNDFTISRSYCGTTDVISDNTKKKRKIILVGDINDKGKYTKEVIEFIHRNKEWFKLVMGNHENFVYKYLKGKLKKDILPQEFLEEQFGSIFELREDDDVREKFFELVESSQPFYRSKYFIVTHAPCKNKYLGKFDRDSIKSQRTIQYPKQADFETREEFIKGYEDRLSFLKEEAQSNQPFHVFGHTSFHRVLKLKNKLGIDTDCVKGGRMSSVVINGRFKPFFADVANHVLKLPKSEQVELFRKTEKNIKYFDLSDRERYRITKLGENKVNFISGTMCPADKDIDKGLLESMANALSYYKSRGVRKVILQPKYMGSRCNIYLFQDIENCYATSRNGYSINKKLDLSPVYQSLLDKHLVVMQENKIKLKIIDVELMPWFALGKGLIESQYAVVEKAIESENTLLAETDFEKHLKDVPFKMAHTDFLKDHGSHADIHRKPKHPLISLAYRAIARTPFYNPKSLSKQELVKKYTHTVYSTFKNYLNFSKAQVSLEDQVALHKVYKEQIGIYGSEEELAVKPFAILKDVYEDGSEELYFDATNEDVFKHVSDDAYLLIDLEDEDALAKAEAFYSHLTVDLKMEGAVVKPNDAVFIEGLAPYRKVRNKDYLTLIYGYDYLTKNKYDKLLRQKRIDRKLTLSIREFALGKRMLEVPYDSIEPKNKEYENLVMQMIVEEKREIGLDPRL